jgi:hypothetical protein
MFKNWNALYLFLRFTSKGAGTLKFLYFLIIIIPADKSAQTHFPIFSCAVQVNTEHTS